MLVARRASNVLCNSNCPNSIKGTARIPEFSLSIPNREKRFTELGYTARGLISAYPAAYVGFSRLGWARKIY